jgi:hypothetical protein
MMLTATSLASIIPIHHHDRRAIAESCLNDAEAQPPLPTICKRARHPNAVAGIAKSTVNCIDKKEAARKLLQSLSLWTYSINRGVGDDH